MLQNFSSKPSIHSAYAKIPSDDGRGRHTVGMYRGHLVSIRHFDHTIPVQLNKNDLIILNTVSK